MLKEVSSLKLAARQLRRIGYLDIPSTTITLRVESMPGKRRGAEKSVIAAAACQRLAAVPMSGSPARRFNLTTVDNVLGQQTPNRRKQVPSRASPPARARRRLS